ncbi:beta-1,3-galactosyl-O-glycosyl-glycoprotein beta-1,6-N-acetylglucosaminyltransferase-like [Glandiceps talaboti]
MFVPITRNCSFFLHSEGYINKPVSQEEINFPLAFSIMIHTSAHQVEQLLRTIYRPHNIYCIHIDKKAPSELHTAMKAITSCFDNVFIASRLDRVVWGTITQVHAERSCQKELLVQNQKWKYLINLTGQEFPLKTNLEIVQILKQFQGQNDIVTLALAVPNRTEVRHYIREDKLYRTEIRKTEPKPEGIVLYKGGVQSALTRPFVKFLHTRNIAEVLLIWLNDTAFPDEVFSQSLASLPEAPGGPGIIGSAASVSRLVNWKTMPHCKGIFIRGVCIFSWQDLPWIVKQPQLFVNKLKVNFDALALQCLEEWINYRTFHPIEMNLNLYRTFAKVRTVEALRNLEKWVI